MFQWNICWKMASKMCKQRWFRLQANRWHSTGVSWLWYNRKGDQHLRATEALILQRRLATDVCKVEGPCTWFEGFLLVSPPWHGTCWNVRSPTKPEPKQEAIPTPVERPVFFVVRIQEPTTGLWPLMLLIWNLWNFGIIFLVLTFGFWNSSTKNWMLFTKNIAQSWRIRDTRSTLIEAGCLYTDFHQHNLDIALQWLIFLGHLQHQKMQILQNMFFPVSNPGDFAISILPRRFCRVPISPPPRRSGRMAPLADGNHYIAQATLAKQVGHGRWFQAIKNILPSRELTYIIPPWKKGNRLLKCLGGWDMSASRRVNSLELDQFSKDRGENSKNLSKHQI